MGAFPLESVEKWQFLGGCKNNEFYFSNEIQLFKIIWEYFKIFFN